MKRSAPEPMEGENTPKTILRPKNEGESLKVAQVVLKRRERNLHQLANRAQNIARHRKNLKEAKKGSVKIVKPERLIKDALARRADRKRANKIAKHRPHLVRGTKTIVAVRNSKTRKQASHTAKAVLQELDLGSCNTMVFLKNSKDIVKKLDAVRPFVYWGACSHKVIYNLLHKKAEFRGDEGERTPLSDNALIEKHLGDIGVLCTEDLVHSIHACDENFDQVKKRLWPIKVADVNKTDKMVHDYTQLNGRRKNMDEKVRKLIGL
mmetsp:Transcript_57091/g.121320  ORF Transcript_57091/g.121320 Transcript_57091/m.121320 type:complete len:265 (-) Transcript_57091:87-881(-)|eukprot:CAMPEP_0206470828 /NCGR_PEP_ID=MMETSP0324_2-20121206/31179_1 /ASSEMBLY_ACC=CAM_ASM_000836 /TAXON_ID=2866 /ORGANISM="Crypthecodinium cohnii, Strain Seligo" /LENGTH=264 /DNA_ID=CAMNT_0053944995 /DNA_START=132 /DNA_END=926 /DNA_ORIENTATION=+